MQAQRVGYLETPKGRLGPVSPTLGPSMQKPNSLASVMNRKGSDVGIRPAAGSLSHRLRLILKKKGAHGIHKKVIASENSWRVSALSTAMEHNIKI